MRSLSGRLEALERASLRPQHTTWLRVIIPAGASELDIARLENEARAAHGGGAAVAFIHRVIVAPTGSAGGAHA